MKLSIILCVYNTKIEYVEQCLDSVFSSTAKDFEVIFVDDGSDVDYSSVCEKHPIKYLKTENRGLLRARLLGIEAACGKYVAFVDSDDRISINYHLPMIEAAERFDADIVFNDWAFDFGSYQNYPLRDSTMASDIDCSGEDALKFYTSQQGREQSYFVQWNKLFSRELLLASKSEMMRTELPQMEITYAEDVIFNFFNFKNAKRVTNVHTGFYFYRIHNEQSVSIPDFAKLCWQIDSMVYAFDLMERNVGGNINEKAIRENLLKWKGHMARFHYGYAEKLSDNSATDYVCERYQMKPLSSPLKKDSWAYERLEFIGSNFAETDKVLAELYLAGKASARYTARAKYIKRFLCYILRFKGEHVQSGKSTVLKNIITLKQKILSSNIGSRLASTYRAVKKLFK